MQDDATAVGCDGKENMMNATTKTLDSERSTAVMAALFVAVAGLALLFAAGHAQSAALHDAAHDVRHASGFPCH